MDLAYECGVSADSPPSHSSIEVYLRISTKYKEVRGIEASHPLARCFFRPYDVRFANCSTFEPADGVTRQHLQQAREEAFSLPFPVEPTSWVLDLGRPLQRGCLSEK